MLRFSNATMPSPTVLSKSIRVMQQRTGTNDDDLAKALNITPRSVKNWRRGLSGFHQKRAQQVAAFFGVTVEELFEVGGG